MFGSLVKNGFKLSVLCLCMNTLLFSNMVDYLDNLFKDRDVNFIQVGSNSGDNLMDPIFKLIHKNKWSGVLIEPVPYIYKKLIENYKGVENLYFENIAIADEEGVKDFYYFTEETYNDYKKRGVNYMTDSLGSFRKNHITDHLKNPNLRLDIMQVECKTVDYITDKYEINHLDLLNLDTEGYDVEILNSIDFDKIHPDAILFEHLHTDGTWKTGKNFTKCINRLRKYGYSIALQQGYDTLLIDKSKF